MRKRGKKQKAKAKNASKEKASYSNSLAEVMSEMEDARHQVEQLRADQEKARKLLQAAKIDSQKAESRAKHAKSGIDRARVIVDEPNAIFGETFDADLDDISDSNASAPKYGDQEYWETRFQEETDTNTAFEWYQDYDGELQSRLQNNIPNHCRHSGGGSVLIVGCGNSLLSEQMFDDGYVSITSVDFSGSVIAAMQERAEEQSKNGLVYIEMDARQLEFEGASFDAAIDKGTIDAVLSDESGKGYSNAEQICCEVMRVLSVGGVYIVISSIQEEYYGPLFRQFCGQVECQTLSTLYNTGDQFSEKTYMYKLTKTEADASSNRSKLQSALFKARQLQGRAQEQSQAAVSQVQHLREQFEVAKAEKQKHGQAADVAMAAWKPELEKELEQQLQAESKRAYQKHERLALQIIGLIYQRYAESKGLEHDEQEGTGYTWSQTEEDLLISVPVPSGTTVKDIQCDVHARIISIGLVGSEPLVEGRFPRKVIAHESLWSVVDGNMVQINLQKAQPVYWDCALDGDTKLDMDKVRDYRKVADDLKGMNGSQEHETRTCSIHIVNSKSRAQSTSSSEEMVLTEARLKVRIRIAATAVSDAIAKHHDSIALFAEGDEADLKRGYCDSVWVDEEFYETSSVIAELSLPTDACKKQRYHVFYLNDSSEQLGRSAKFHISMDCKSDMDEFHTQSILDDTPGLENILNYMGAAQFEGRKQGYVFKTGVAGLGYHLDQAGINSRDDRSKTTTHCASIANATVPYYVLEKQTNIGCYQLLIMLPERHKCPDWQPKPLLRLSAQRFCTEFAGPQRDDGSSESYALDLAFESTVAPVNSTMDIREDHLAFRFPIIEEEKALLTLESRDSSCLTPDEFKAKTFHDLACRFCLQSIVKTSSIKRTFPLPSAHWGDLVDYWVCEECNMGRNWALTLSPKPKPGSCLIGEAHIMLHEDDILTTSIAARHTNEMVISCGRCDSSLGCTSGKRDGVVKLWKHRLSGMPRLGPKNSTPDFPTLSTGGILSRYTAAAPIAAQILHSAQARGCYHFMICTETSAAPSSKAQRCPDPADDWLLLASSVLDVRATRPRLKLQLVNWDSRVATHLHKEERAVLTVMYDIRCCESKQTCEQVICDEDDFVEVDMICFLDKLRTPNIY